MSDYRGTDGLAAVSITTTEKSILSKTPLNIAGTGRWGFAVKPVGADITLRVYKYFGPNIGRVEISALETTIPDGDVHVVEFADEVAMGIEITGQTASGTATVACDFRYAS